MIFEEIIAQAEKVIEELRTLQALQIKEDGTYWKMVDISTEDFQYLIYTYKKQIAQLRLSNWSRIRDQRVS